MDAANNIFKFSEKLHKKITKVDKIRKSHLLNYWDVITVENYKLTNYIKILIFLLPIRLKPNLVAVLL